jgi:hypothetical protein
MPYVEGETLRRRLERDRQLPVTDAVRIATEVLTGPRQGGPTVSQREGVKAGLGVTAHSIFRPGVCRPS